jgi:phage terminase Nu1 subunit (DNA packaging protein)
MILTTNEIAQLFGVVPRAVTLWGEKGCPKLKVNTWDLRKVMMWWIENIYEIEKDPDSDISAFKTDYWRHHARLEKAKADLLEGSVMKKADIVTEWAWRAAEMGGNLAAVPLRISPLLEGLNEIERRKVLDEEMWTIRDNFSRKGRFTG